MSITFSVSPGWSHSSGAKNFCLFLVLGWRPLAAARWGRTLTFNTNTLKWLFKSLFNSRNTFWAITQEYHTSWLKWWSDNIWVFLFMYINLSNSTQILVLHRYVYFSFKLRVTLIPCMFKPLLFYKRWLWLYFSFSTSCHQGKCNNIL